MAEQGHVVDQRRLAHDIGTKSVQIGIAVVVVLGVVDGGVVDAASRGHPALQARAAGRGAAIGLPVLDEVEVIAPEVRPVRLAEVGVAVVVTLGLEARAPPPALGHAVVQKVFKCTLPIIGIQRLYIVITTDVVIEVIHRGVALLEALREPKLLGDSRGVRHAERLELGVRAEIIVVIADVIDKCMLDDDAGDSESAGLADDTVVILRVAAVRIRIVDIARVVVTRLDAAVVKPESGELVDNLLSEVDAHGVGLCVVPVVVRDVDLGAIRSPGPRGVEMDAHKDARTGICSALRALLERGVFVLAAREHDLCSVLVHELVTAVVGNLPGKIGLVDAVYPHGTGVISTMTGVERNYETRGA